MANRAGSLNLLPKGIFVEGAAPATPAAETVIIYAKADGLMYAKDDTGAEKLLGGVPTWGSIIGTLSGQTDLQTALNAKAALVSPSFTTPNIGVATGTSFTTAGLVVAGVQALSGAGAVDVLAQSTKLTTTEIGQVLTLANGVNGQVKRIVYAAEGGAADSAVLTPTTKTGYVTITFTTIGNAIVLQYFTTQGWMIVSNYECTVV